MRERGRFHLVNPLMGLQEASDTLLLLVCPLLCFGASEGSLLKVNERWFNIMHTPRLVQPITGTRMISTDSSA